MALVAFTRVSDGLSVEIESSLVAALVDQGANTDIALQGLDQPVRVVGTLAVVSAALAAGGGASPVVVGGILAAGTWTGAGATLFATPGLTIGRTGVGLYLLAVDDAQAAAGAIVVTLGDDPAVQSTCTAQQAAPGPAVGNWTVQCLDSAGLAVDPDSLNAVIVRTA